jgi:hypothetical protein
VVPTMFVLLGGFRCGPQLLCRNQRASSRIIVRSMKTFIILAQTPPKSVNRAMFRTADATLRESGHEGRTSDLHAMRFKPKR